MGGGHAPPGPPYIGVPEFLYDSKLANCICYKSFCVNIAFLDSRPLCKELCIPVASFRISDPGVCFLSLWKILGNHRDLC